MLCVRIIVQSQFWEKIAITFEILWKILQNFHRRFFRRRATKKHKIIFLREKFLHRFSTKNCENLGVRIPVTTTVPSKVRVTMYTTILRPILVYGSEAWTLTSKTRSMVQAAEMRVLRLIKGVTKLDRLRNENIQRELGLQSILSFIEESQLRWFGHVKRMGDHRTPKRWLDWRPTTTRPVGRPRKRWIENVSAALTSRQTSLAQVEETRLYQDRKAWRRLICADRP